MKIESELLEEAKTAIDNDDWRTGYLIISAIKERIWAKLFLQGKMDQMLDHQEHHGGGHILK